jgi:hypothetical protein
VKPHNRPRRERGLSCVLECPLPPLRNSPVRFRHRPLVGKRPRQTRMGEFPMPIYMREFPLVGN